MLRLQSFWYGLKMPAQALKVIISQPRLVFWSLLPLLITLAFYASSFHYLQNQTNALMQHSFATWGMDPNGWLVRILLFFSKVLLFLVASMTFSMTANIVACPFNDFLAEHAEAYATPPFPKAPPKRIVERLELIGIDLLKTLVAAGINLVALLFSWIPFLGLVSLLLTFLVISFQFISYPQTRRGQGLAEGVRFVWTNLDCCLGFGISFAFLFSIPVLAGFFLPLAVVGGTLLVAQASANHSKTKM